jgi:hypothetical protein
MIIMPVTENGRGKSAEKELNISRITAKTDRLKGGLNMVVYMIIFFLIIGTLFFHFFLKPPYNHESLKESLDNNASCRELLTKSEAANANG